MRTKFRLGLAALAVSALTVATAAPAGAQEEPAALGFAVDKTQAPPGALVLGKADAADVAEHCVTDLEAFQARFNALWQDEGPFTPEPGFEIFDTIFPDNAAAFDTFDKMGFTFLFLTFAGIGGLLGPEPAEDALPQTFVMTFADIATQDPVGERGSFDPDTGDGSVIVPDIEPGNWAVAAACVGPSFDVEVLFAGVHAAAALFEEIGMPIDVEPLGTEMFEFMQDFLDSEAAGFDLVAEFLGELGPTLLEPIMVPDAFGAVIFCILDAQGECPGPPPPPPELPPEEAAKMTPPAQPVVAAPSFTG